MAKQIFLEHIELEELITILTPLDISNDIMVKLTEAYNREQKDYYKKSKKIVSSDGFVLYEYSKLSPLEYWYEIKKVRRIQDHSKTIYSCLSGNSYCYPQKINVFAHKWEAKLYAFNTHIKLLNDKIKKLKTDKGKAPYLDLVIKNQKRIDYIENHPEKLV